MIGIEKEAKRKYTNRRKINNSQVREGNKNRGKDTVDITRFGQRETSDAEIFFDGHWYKVGLRGKLFRWSSEYREWLLSSRPMEDLRKAQKQLEKKK